MSLEIGGIPCEYAQTQMQLPSIHPEDDNGLLLMPHVFLDEIMRQAADSEIIRVSMAIREGRPLECGYGKDVSIIQVPEVEDDLLAWSDEIIVATNKTRNEMNSRVREMRGLRGAPKPQDRLIIKRNYWDVLTDEGDSLVNGTVGSIIETDEYIVRLPRHINVPENKRAFPVISAQFISDEGKSFGRISMDKNFFFSEMPCVDASVAFQIGKKCRGGGNEYIPKLAAFGYAITAHSAQGSSWENVLIVEENFPYAPIEHARWLYTAITRAEKGAIIARKV